MKILIFFIGFIFLLNFVSGLEIGISPIKMEFYSQIDEKVCKNFILHVKNYSGLMFGETRWKTGERSMNLKDYTLKNNYLEIEAEFPEKIEIINKDLEKSLEICIIGKKPGVYYGALLYRGEESYAGVGNWLIVNVKNREQEVSKISLSGFVVGSSSYGKSNLSPLLILMTFLLVFMLFLIRRRKKKSFN